MLISKCFIGRYEIMTITDILTGSDLLNLLVFISVDKIDLKIKPQEKSTLYYSQSGEEINGCIVLAVKHGVHDMNYFKQELNRYSTSNCFIFKIIYGNNSMLLFSLTPRNSIIVDTNAELIPLGNDLDKYDAKKLKSVSHYTTVKSAIEILSSEMFMAKSLSRYTSERSFALSENSRRLHFITCFSFNQDNKNDMWAKFADKYKGCKMDLFFKKSILEAFRLNKPLKCYTLNGEIYYIPHVAGMKDSGFGSSYLNRVYVSEYFYKTKYNAEFSNKSNLTCYDPSMGITNFTIVGETGSYVQSKYEFQEEVRIILMLHAPSKIEIPFLTKVELPFSFECVDSMVVTLGKNISTQNEIRLCNLIKELKVRHQSTSFYLKKLQS